MAKIHLLPQVRFTTALMVLAPFCYATTLRAADARVAPPSETSKNAPSVSNIGLQLDGIVVEGKLSLASIRKLSDRKSEWLAVGDGIDDYAVTKIDESAVTLINRRSKEPITLSLAKASINEGSNEPKIYTERWINSKSNPMLLNPQSLPHSLLRNWTNLNKDEIAAIVEYYRMHGWILTSLDIQGGLPRTIVWHNIYDEERRAASQENYRRFENSLSADDLAEWQSMQTAPTIHIENGVLTPEQQATADARKRRYEAFISKLSSEKRAQLSSIPDFTQAWNPKK